MWFVDSIPPLPAFHKWKGMMDKVAALFEQDTQKQKGESQRVKEPKPQRNQNPNLLWQPNRQLKCRGPLLSKQSARLAARRHRTVRPQNGCENQKCTNVPKRLFFIILPFSIAYGTPLFCYENEADSSCVPPS